MVTKSYNKNLHNFYQVDIVEEEDDFIPNKDDVVDEENGLFNEFGAPDPDGLPIEVVLAEPIAEIPQIIQPQEAELWTDVPILQQNDTRSGRRNDRIESTIPKFLGRETKILRASR